ncbi:MAG: class I SAM-dependent methyltransferase [Planctomycetota bacterium]|jgi:SAM-dependent methyltransferase
MRVCLSCEHRFESDAWACPRCRFEPATVNGHPAFAPELAAANDGYDPSRFEEVDASVGDSFWVRARRELFRWAMRSYCPDATSVLEIGCATGLMLPIFREAFPRAAIHGSEIFSAGLDYAARRVPDATVFQVDARRIPFDAEFDVIGAFDVIEHIDDDRRVLEQIHQATRPGGCVLLSVPHHPFLWSQRDEAVFHKRRYTRSELLEKTRQAGFEVVRTTAFISLPFPAMVLDALRNKRPREGYNPLEALQTSRVTETLLSWILGVERGLIRAGVSFPFGGTLLVVARRPSTTR